MSSKLYEQVKQITNPLIKPVRPKLKVVRDIDREEPKANRVVISRDILNKLIVLTSGKGGVGKSTLASVLSTALSKKEKRVLILDLDFDLPDLHKIIGGRPDKSFNHIIRGDCKLKEAITRSSIRNVHYVGGEASRFYMGDNETYRAFLQGLSSLSELNYDYIILDVGGNSGQVVVESYRLSKHKIVVLNPCELSKMDSKNLIRRAVYRILIKKFKGDTEAIDLIYRLEDSNKNIGFNTMNYIKGTLKMRPGNYNERINKINQVCNAARPTIVINKCRTKKQAVDVYTEFAGKVRKELSVECIYGGWFPQTNAFYIDDIINESWWSPREIKTMIKSSKKLGELITSVPNSNGGKKQ